MEDRWLRVEMLAALGRIDEAHAIAERLPDHTPVARVERAALLGYTSWLAGGGAQVEELRAAVAEVEPRDGDDRLRAEVSLAMAEVRALIADGDPDPAAPLRAVRDRIGTRADRVMLLAARRQVEAFLKLAAIGVITVTLIARALPT